jgi:hypothetical protein
MSVNVFVKLIAWCCQAAAGLDEDLSERSVGSVTIYATMVVFMATIWASMLLEAV